MPPKKKIKVTISKLEVVEIIPKTQLIKNLTEIDKTATTTIKYGIQLTPLFSLEKDLIKIDLSIKMSFESESDNEEFLNVGEFSYDFIYRYNTLNDITDEDGVISSEVFLICSNISYSTIRGIIYAKSADTCLADALIPIVTGAELMKGLIKK